jgi:hypothetical protein
MEKNIKVSRNAYGAIVAIEADGKSIPVNDIMARLGDLTSEEGAPILPETFVDFDKKSRGDSLNLDLYGYDPDQNVYVVQIRHFFRRYAKGFANIHKDYVLVGLNETGTAFRHPVGAHGLHAAIRKDPADPIAVVRAAQKWMWEVTDKQLEKGIRQGDVFLYPVRGRPANFAPISETTVVVGESHQINAREFVRDGKGRVYALGPTIRHSKNQHDPVYGEDDETWHAVRLAREANAWEWGARLGD